MSSFIRNKLLISVIILSAVLRLWKLGDIPPHLTSDEAALGYNAYSILKTGRDEYGELLPIIFKSFGDWKPGLYVYTAIPSVAVFGLTEFSVRLPGALFGIIAVWLFYLVVSELTQGSNVFLNNRYAPLLAASLLAISPWHIHFSRGAWEINLTLTLTLAGILFFLRAIRLNAKYFVWSMIFFALTFLAYQGAKMSTTLVMVILVITHWKYILNLPKRSLLFGLTSAVIITFPIILSIFNGQAGRLEVFSIFSYPRPENILQEILQEGNEQKGSLSYVLFHSETLNFLRGILGRWMNHFSGRFLFYEGDWPNPRHSAPYSGMLLWMDMLLLAAGFIALCRARLTAGFIFVILWLLVAPLPSALSRDAVHAVRSFQQIIPLMVIATMGVVLIMQVLSKNRYKVVIFAFLILGYLINYTYWIDQYFNHLPVHNAKYWQFGYKQLVQEISKLETENKEIIIPQSYDQPYIYFLFYKRYDPVKYQKNAKLSVSPLGSRDVGIIDKLDLILFKWIDWHMERGRHGSVIVGNPEQIPINDSSNESDFHLLREIKYPTGELVFRILKVI